MRRTARTCSSATPTCAASCARCSRWPRASAEYDAWATGLRRAETHNRVIAPVVGWDEKKQKVKVSPLARWSDEDVEKYIAENGILVNPLQYDGYPSIGCWPCTRRVADGEDAAQRPLGRHQKDRVRHPPMNFLATIPTAEDAANDDGVRSTSPKGDGST